MPESTDSVLIKASPTKASPSEADVALARAALLEITPAETVGELAGSITETDGVTTIYFDNTLRGYVGWKWTVSISHGEGASVSVLETELTPAEGALIAPDWVPWSERLAEYKETQAELAAQALEHEHDDDDDDDSDDDDDDDDDSDDDDDDDDDDEVLLHGGDLDGVDIDSLDDSANTHDAHALQGSALPNVSVEKSKKAKDESDDTRPEPPLKPRRNQRAKKQQQDDKAD